MTKQQAIDKAGSVLNLAVLLGITREAIYQWGEMVPQARVWQLKALHPDWF
jgi:tRNA U34 5-methylaminomethyl-2-thiouridine-forming methyltransferase MnmC